MTQQLQEIFRTTDNTVIYFTQGRKSEFDFIVKYKPSNTHRERTPRHIHLIADLYVKRQGNKELTSVFVQYIIENIIHKVKSIDCHPPKLQTFNHDDWDKFRGLDKFGDYSVETFLVLAELIIIQEKTNYPNGQLSFKLFDSFLREKAQFTIISMAARGK